MNGLWNAYLCPTSPRYEQWRRVLGNDSDEVPLLDARERLANLGEAERDVPVYLVDVKQLGPEQLARLVRLLAEKCGVREDEVRGQLESGVFPIRTEDAFIAFSLRAFL